MSLIHYRQTSPHPDHLTVVSINTRVVYFKKVVFLITSFYCRGNILIFVLMSTNIGKKYYIKCYDIQLGKK